MRYLLTTFLLATTSTLSNSPEASLIINPEQRKSPLPSQKTIHLYSDIHTESNWTPFQHLQMMSALAMDITSANSSAGAAAPNRPQRPFTEYNVSKLRIYKT